MAINKTWPAGVPAGKARNITVNGTVTEYAEQHLWSNHFEGRGNAGTGATSRRLGNWQPGNTNRSGEGQDH